MKFHASVLVIAILCPLFGATASYGEEATSQPNWAIAIHGGAGSSPAQLDEASSKKRSEGLQKALQAGRDLLAAGGTALDTVEAVIRVMEDDPIFNAGRGAVLTEDGRAELDASIMDGKTLGCGAVAGVTKVKNPISLARRVMTNTQHVLLVGPGADQFAAGQQVPLVDPDYFITKRDRRDTANIVSSTHNSSDIHYGTVGCVVLDSHGNLAAGTSTGGTAKKLPGRVGDSPIVGAGTYAANGLCAVSGTGVGEEYIRNSVAYDVAAQMRYEGKSLESSITEIMFERLSPGIGGLIAVSQQGDIVMQHNTPGMSCGAADSTGRFETHLVLENGGAPSETISLAPAQADDAIGKEFRDFSSLWPLEATYWSGDGFFTQPSNALGSSILYAYDSRGYLLGYQQFPQSRWVQTIAADGVYAAGDFSGRPFQQDPLGNGWRLFSTLVNEGYLGPLVTSKGVMVIEQDPVGLRTLLEQDIEMGAVIPTPAGKAPRLILGIGNQLHEYRLIDETGSEDWYVEPDLNSNLQARQTSKSLKLNVEWVRTFDVPESLTHLEMHSVAWAPEELLIWQNTRRWDDVDVLKLRPNVPAKLLKFSVQPESVPAPHEDKFSMTMVACGFLPGAFYLLFLAISAWMVLTGHPSAGTPFPEIAANPISASTALISFVFVMALAFWLVRRVAYRRGLSSRQTRLWMWAVPAVTLAAPLSMVAMYRLVHREPCPSCGQPRRVDLIRCEHCEADWVQPETEGIEIVDRVA